jgi:ABC-type uncharacterized transport system permease subunit
VQMTQCPNLHILGLDHTLMDGWSQSLLSWHVSLTLLAYGFLVAASVSAGMYLVVDGQLRFKAAFVMRFRLPSLEALNTWERVFVAIGFILLTVGLALGSLLVYRTACGAAYSTWLVDAKVIWSLILWGVYALCLLLHGWYRWGGRKTAYLALVGMVVLVLNMLVVGLFSSFH